MESLGEQLKKGREEKNISLDDVVKATKINKNTLSALENNHYELFPPKVFVKGFIRNYARYVGLEEKELLDLYEKAYDTKIVVATPEEVKGRKKINFKTCGAISQNLLHYISEVKGRKKINFNILIVLLIVLLGLIIVIASFSFLKNQGNRRSELPKKLNNVASAIPPRAETLPSHAENSPLYGVTSIVDNNLPTTPPVAEAKRAITNPASPLLVKMQAKCSSSTWIRYVVDNGQPSQIFLVPGDEFSWAWTEKIELKLGNAGGIKVRVNGMPLKPLGKPGEVQDVVFGRDTITLRGGEPQKLNLWKEDA